MVTRYEHFSFLISGLARCIQRIEREEMVRYGLKGSYAPCLAAMHRHPDGLTAAQLCDICDKDKAAISRAVADMEEKGLIRRDTDRSTYRVPLVLTEEGNRAAEYVRDRAQAAVEAAVEGVPIEDIALMYRTLGLIGENLQTYHRDE